MPFPRGAAALSSVARSWDLLLQRVEGGEEMPCVVVVGGQWGDEGKGKIVDRLTQRAQVVVRYQGGPNAGHTVVVDGKRFALRHLPSGILRPEVLSVVANGVVIDPASLLQEIHEIRQAGVWVESNLRVSDR